MDYLIPAPAFRKRLDRQLAVRFAPGTDRLHGAVTSRGVPISIFSVPPGAKPSRRPTSPSARFILTKIAGRIFSGKKPQQDSALTDCTPPVRWYIIPLPPCPSFLCGILEMVAWCKKCGALMGLREPLTDWSTDSSGLCPSCAETPESPLAERKKESHSGREVELPPAAAGE
jgi:hypothetical protein